jgi:hypothetical protein
MLVRRDSLERKSLCLTIPRVSMDFVVRKEIGIKLRFSSTHKNSRKIYFETRRNKVIVC